MKKQFNFKNGFLVIEIERPKIKWINKRLLAYVVKCAEAGRFDLLNMSAEEVEKIIKKSQEETT